MGHRGDDWRNRSGPEWVDFAVATLVAIGLTADCPADDFARLKAEIAAGHRQLKESLKQVNGKLKRMQYSRLPRGVPSGTEAPKGPIKIEADLTQPEELTHVEATDFAIDGDRWKCDHSYLLYKTIMREPKLAWVEKPRSAMQTPRSAACVGTSYCFALHWGPESSMPIVDSVSNQASAGFSDQYIGRRVLPALNAATWIAETPLEDMLSDPGFVLKRIERGEESGKELVKIVFDYEPTIKLLVKVPPPVRMNGGWVVLSPSDSWAIAECQVSCKSFPMLYFAKVRFDHSGGKIVPKHVTSGNQGMRAEYEFEALRFEPTPPEAFTLTAFGLPELTKPGRASSGVPIAYWFFSAAILALIAVASLRYWSSRRAPISTGN